MEHYVGIDVSLELSSVCVVDVVGKIVTEAKVESHPATIINFLRKLGLSIERIGLEAGPLSQWLHAGLTKGGFETVLLETRHVKAALSAMTVKTDRRDARGIAQLLRMGWFRPVHCKNRQDRKKCELARGAQTTAGQTLDVESQHPGHSARLRVEDGRSDALGFRGARAGVVRRPSDAGTDRRSDASGARRSADGIREAAQNHVGDRATTRFVAA